MMNTEAPSLVVACSLTGPELQERRSNVLRKVGRSVVETVEVENGYSYRFPADDEWLVELVNLVRLERCCCPFLAFKISAEPGGGSIWLELTGPGGTKEFLSSFLR